MKPWENKKVRNVAFMFGLLIGYLLTGQYVIDGKYGDSVQWLFFTILPILLLSYWFGNVLLQKGIKGVLGFFIGYLAFDIFSIPHVIGYDGQLLTGSLFYQGTTDVQVYNLLHYTLGLNGTMVYYGVYYIVVGLGIIVAATLLTNKEFGELAW